MSAAIPVTREQLLAWHRRRAHAELMWRKGAPARYSGFEVTDDCGDQRVAPRVHCDRDLGAWRPIARTLIRGVIRNDELIGSRGAGDPDAHGYPDDDRDPGDEHVPTFTDF